MYCQSHVPKTGPGKLDGLSVGIKTALNVPKTNHLVNDQIRGSGKGTFDADALGIKTALTTPRPNEADYSKHHKENMAGHFDASALHIQHAVNQTRLQRIYKHAGIESRINEYLVSAYRFLSAFLSTSCERIVLF